MLKNPNSFKKKEIRVAILTDWNTPCGISTYSKYLVDALAPKVDDLKIFSEINETHLSDEEKYSVDYCWKRGQNMSETVKNVIEYNPTVILLQHEFGLFPKANHFLKMLDDLSKIPLVGTVHSVYEHLDKSVALSGLKNIIVHSESGKDCIRKKLKNLQSKIWCIPHGTVVFEDAKPNFNPFDSKHPILQFGFGFAYKNIEMALESIAILKNRHPKFDDIFYLYLSSVNDHTKNIHNSYIKGLKEKAKQLNIQDNFLVRTGFFSDEEINNHLRCTRLSIFPYLTSEKNRVFGASGAIRIAMANANPVIASSSNMFDDLQGVLPRPNNALELANEIARLFSDGAYRKEILRKQNEYILANNWDITADRYKSVFQEIQA